MKSFEKALSIFLLVMGISIIFVWIMILKGGGVPEISSHLFDFIFHWVSELFLAVLSIMLSIALFKTRGWARGVVFYNLGMAISSTLNAVYHYTFKDPSIQLAILTGIFFIISILFLFLSFKYINLSDLLKGSTTKFGLFNIGLLVYLLLNLAGQQGQQGEWSDFSILLFLVGIGLFFMFKLVKINSL